MYKIVGADRKEYGPVTAEQIIQWIRQGRANPQTVARFQDGPWKPLTGFPEFASALSSSIPPAVSSAAGVPPSLGEPPPTYLLQGILCTLCCCLPIGIVALIFSAQVKSKFAAGDV